jgi:hypothetical protein
MSDIVERLRAMFWAEGAPMTTAHEAADEIERLGTINAELVRALTPFALNVGAVSLSRALGHITREDLLQAHAALAKAGGKE